MIPNPKFVQTLLDNEFTDERSDPGAWDSGEAGILEAEEGGGHEAECEDD